MPADTEHHVFAAIDDFSLFLELPAALSLEFLATDIANWITHTNSGIAVGKVDLLCSVTFQELAGGALGHEFIRHFRLVLWITTLSQTAKHNTTFLAQTQAMDTLERWLHFYGKNVVLHLDTKCRAHSIRKLSGEECKALFLVIIGMCLSATYAHPARNNSTVGRINTFDKSF
jgi:hypothetical protein